jgi:hypothetical protein
VTAAYASRLGFTAKPLAMTAAHGSRDASLAVDFAVQAGRPTSSPRRSASLRRRTRPTRRRRPTPSPQALTPPVLTGSSRSPSARGPTAGRATSCCPTIKRCSARSERRSSTSRRASDRARTGASLRWGCRRAATTTTSSGTWRRGCTRPCYCSIRTWRRASSTTGQHDCRRPRQRAGQPQLLRAADRPGRPGDNGLHPRDRLAGARRARLSRLPLHASQRGALRATAYDQFTEARGAQSTFTFLTGEGGFLQTFLYGWSGFRWRSDRIHLSPTLPDQRAANGLTLRGLAYQDAASRSRSEPSARRSRSTRVPPCRSRLTARRPRSARAAR